MLQNIITSKLFLRNYLVFTLVVSLVHFLLFLLRYELVWFMAVADAAISVFLLALALLSLYFVIRYARSESITSHSSLRNSVIAGVVLVLAWLFTSSGILKLLFNWDEQYLAFLEQSMALRFIAGMFVASLVYLSFFLAIYQANVQESSQRENELKLLLQKTELQSLKNQLNPHFIYNSLNSISALTLYSPDKAREMVGLLSDFLRIALRQDPLQTTSLENELKNIELYLQIEKVRFEEKLNWQFFVDESLLSRPIPAMILQPLFENAVKHGVQQIADPGGIILRVTAENNNMQVIIENSFDADFQRFKGEGVGLENIRNRMRLMYGSSYGLQTRVINNTFSAKLKFPITDANKR